MSSIFGTPGGNVPLQVSLRNSICLQRVLRTTQASTERRNTAAEAVRHRMKLSRDRELTAYGTGSTRERLQ